MGRGYVYLIRVVHNKGRGYVYLNTGVKIRGYIYLITVVHNNSIMYKSTV